MAVKSYNSPKKVGTLVQGGISNNLGILSPLGTMATAISVGENVFVAVYNDNATTAFVRVGDAGVVIGTSFVQNIAIPPKSYIYVNTGGYRYVVSSASVYGYLVMDESSPSIE